MTVFADPLPALGAPLGRHDPSWSECRAPCRAALAAAPDFALISSRQAFDALQDEWSALFERAGAAAQIFQSFNWNWHWCNHYLDHVERGRNHSLAIVTVRQAGVLVMIWPLVIRRVANLRQLGWMGHPVSQYGDVLADPRCDNAALLARSWDFIVNTLDADLICLRKVRADGIVAPFLGRTGAAVTRREEAVSHNLAAAGDLDCYLSRHSTKARKNRRRQRRRLDERGSVAFTQMEGGERACNAAKAAISMKRAWVASKGLVSPALTDSRFDDFFTAVASRGAHDTGCKVSTLTSAGETAAVEISFDENARRYVHVIAYSLKFERCGAGALHMQDSIARAMADGVKVFDLMAPGTGYKREWADDVTPVLDYAVGLSAPGRAFVFIYLRHLREGAITTLDKMPPRLRRIFNMQM